MKHYLLNKGYVMISRALLMNICSEHPKAAGNFEAFLRMLVYANFETCVVQYNGEEIDANSIGICYEGGLDEYGRAADTRTPFQKHSLRVLVMLLLRDYPDSRLCGHRDLSPDLNHNGEIEPEEWIKACPCFDASTVLTEAPPPNPGYNPSLP